MEHYQFRITGKVQGVFFRQTSKEKADEFGVKGFARNEPDGSVYIEAEGAPEALEKFGKWCETGPENARVEQVKTTPGKPKGYTTFEVKR